MRGGGALRLVKIPRSGDGAHVARMAAARPWVVARAGDVIGSGKGRRGCRRIGGEAVKPGGFVLEMIGDDMDDVGVALDSSAHEHEAGGHDDGAIGGKRIGPDDNIADAELIFESNEDDTLGAAGTLADKHDAGHGDRFAVAYAPERGIVGDALVIA